MARLFRDCVAFLAGIRGNKFRFLAVSSVASTALIMATAFGSGHSDKLISALNTLASAPVDAVASDSTPAPAAPVVQSQPSGGGATDFAPAAVQASTGTGDTSSGGGQTKKPATTTKPTLGRVKHVFVISLASPGYDASFGTASKMPYLSSLRSQGELLDGYSLVSSSALPNYIAMTSGQPPNTATKGECSTYSEFATGVKPGADGVVPGDACIYPVTTPSIADQISSAGLVWHAYMEDMAKPCDRPAPGATDPTATATSGYVTRHNPFAYYHSALDVGDCTANDLPLSRLSTDLGKATTTANYNFIAPNLCHGGVEVPCASGDPGGPATSDTWLSTIVPQIVSSPAYQADGLIIVTFGETAPKDPADGARVGTLLLSKFLTPGATRSEAFDPYALLRSLQDIFKTKHYAKANSTTLSFAPEVLGPAVKAKKKKTTKKKKSKKK
jgi:hypothetical protein